MRPGNHASPLTRRLHHYELQLARTERALLAQVLKESGEISALDASQKESDLRIQFLENALAEEKKSVMERTPDERFSAQAIYETGQKSGQFCGGSYSFDAQFFYGMTSGAVTMQGNWSEFGPYAPYNKQFYVRARAWMYDPYILNSDSELSPVFTNTCCFSTRQVSAGIDPTFTPALEAYGYILGSNGCGSRTYTAKNF